MKSILRQLYFTNHRHYEVWNFLYLMSDDGKYEFTYLDICHRFKLPKSTLARILKLAQGWSEYAVKVEQLQKGHQVIFEEKTQQILPPPEKDLPPLPVIAPIPKPMEKELMDFLESWYVQKSKVYPDLRKHKRHANEISRKITELLKLAGDKVDNDGIVSAFKMFFNKIPDWWVVNQPLLPSINKHFPQIYNQIKTHKNGTINPKTKPSKIDSYAAAALIGIDPEKFASND